MNINSQLPPLPDALRQPRSDGARRRCRIGDAAIDPGALSHFNKLLEHLDVTQPPLDCDRLASAARELADTEPEHTPGCIAQRMRRAAVIDRMLGDREWEIVRNSEKIAAMLVQYLRGDRNVIPNSMPAVGRLDDAILVEAAWPQVAQEVHDYLDFCRLRRIEAALRGEPEPYVNAHFGFSRDDWKAAARAEKAWIAHCQRVDTDSYVTGDREPLFRVS